MKKSYITAGLGFGDESKGQTVDFLTKRFGGGLVVRYSGACQCGHNVVQPDGRHHCFQQFGAGTFHSGVRTHLSRFMLIAPQNQMREEEHLREISITDAWKRLTVEEDCLIVVPFHREINRHLAKPGTNSCGQGIGVCREMHLHYGDKVLFAKDLYNETRTREKLRFIRDLALELLDAGDVAAFNRRFGNGDPIDLFWSWYRDWREFARIVPRDYLRVLLNQTDTVVFEGAQGVLLDEKHGSPGYNTWTDCTFGNATALLDESYYDGERVRVGVTRTYATRHGAGPFLTEDPTLTYPEPHNEDASYQGKFRRGHFDSHSFLDAIRILGGIDMLAVNHNDVVPWRCPMEVLELPTIYGWGPTYADRKLE